VSAPSERIVLAERPARGAYAIVLDDESFVVEGVARLGRRRVPYLRVYGLERAGAWLWVGVGLVPVALGGEDVPSEQLARLEAALRARIGALPDGASRLARFDARRTLRLQFPWLTAALCLGFALVSVSGLASGTQETLRFTTNLLLLLSLGLLAEPWLGATRTFVSGALALLTASALSGDGIGLALAPLAPALGWAGSLVFARLRREPVLGVRFRSALDSAALLVVALGAHALSLASGSAALLLAGLVGFGIGPLLLRGWQEGSAPRLH
jgi:hypothetical protein